ncbi:MAG: tyrosine-protein kinase family protein [Geobacteraceae bacterium]|nr:tyrosine-protein kinase family protein [Geobacteraceae bacterium]NTW79772.1 tyrosine-protein kinase family protein [Geobacteraceae bacterium]
MSRIEKAMERAAQIRQGAAAPPASQEQPYLRPIHTHPPPVTGTDLIVPSSPFLISMDDPYSPLSEEFRKLKTELIKLTKGATFNNTVQVTSAVPNEGKSLTALNLAISLAQEYDHTVLLIDADFRRPSIHSYLGIEQKIGFSDCLLGEAEIGEVIIPTGIGKLSVITAGRGVLNPPELFASQKTRELIADMKNRYHDRFIIFDSPPVLPFAEARTLANLVDGVLFVVKEQLASQKNVKEAISALKGCGLLGMVYNDAIVDRNDEKYTSYHRYGQIRR